MNVLWRIGGAAIFLGGWSVFGAAFEFINVNRDMSAIFMIPILVVWVCLVAVMIFAGGAIAWAGNPFAIADQSRNGGDA